MKKLLTLLFACSSISGVHAQVRIAAIGQQLQTLPSPLPESEVLDTARCVVFYRHSYPTDNFVDGFKRSEDLLCLQIGTHMSKTFSQNLYLWDRNLTYDETNRVKLRFDLIDYQIFYGHPRGSLTVDHRIPFSRLLQGSTQVVRYEEPVPQIDWEIAEQTDTIAGYRCLAAEGDFGGRRWKVWFAPEIPLPYGPWKLGGLPGLILRAEDSRGDYLFEMERIAADSEPIRLYDWHPVRMPKSKWLKTERAMHEYPKDYFTKGGEIQILNAKTRQPLEDDWKVRYNPIETE